MFRRLKRLVRLVFIGLALVLVTFLATRVYFSQSGAPLEPWHTFVPHELSIKEMDKADWPTFLKA
ncbi:MAG TPA: alpha/beta hydrolase, partial [Ancylobacter sp.]